MRKKQASTINHIMGLLQMYGKADDKTTKKKKLHVFINKISIISKIFQIINNS